jgi:asparagine synthase (glutamine-hydrolysing)
MCGIFAVFHKTGFGNDKYINTITNDNRYSTEQENIKSQEYINILVQNAKLLNHRGEIDNYKIINNKLFFYHNRLAINDLSNKGLQPILNNLISVIVNGEIYNYNDLYNLVKNELPTYKFKSNSDSEILIPLYLLYGTGFINKINGMYSFILYDMKKNILLAARDPFGITSLYYAIDNQRIIFSSELKALINLSNNSKNFSPGKMYINGTFYTFYKPNWLINSQQDNIQLPLNEINYEELKAILIDSVYSHIKLTDQPLGFLLSGGLDSSLIVGIANYLKKNNLITNDIYTFTIGLEGGNDINYAESVAKELNTKHTTYTFTFDEVIEELSNVIYYIETYDITTVRASLCNYLLIKNIKKTTDLKVLISGEGSDEIFGGYLYFHKCPSEEEMQLELVDKIINLYKYDCLRSHKSGMANTIEIRVPFLDTKFVNYVMNIKPKYKMITLEQPIEKYILRKAFDNNHFLPSNVLYRQKEQFSDGISNNENNLIEKLKTYANELISDSDYANKHLLYPINTPINKEHMLYRQIFEEQFNRNLNAILTVDHNDKSIACSTKRGLEWLKLDKTSKLNDPSGKSIIDIYKN